MRKFEFTIVAEGLNLEAEDFEDSLFEAGCSDATISVQKGYIFIDFVRTGASLASALSSALVNVRTTGARFVRIEPDYLVSLADIARRSNMTRAAISNYFAGIRAYDFPKPIARITTESPLWDWSQVSMWLVENDRLDPDERVSARIFREANLAVARWNDGQSIERDDMWDLVQKSIAA